MKPKESSIEVPSDPFCSLEGTHSLADFPTLAGYFPYLFHEIELEGKEVDTYLKINEGGVPAFVAPRRVSLLSELARRRDRLRNMNLKSLDRCPLPWRLSDWGCACYKHLFSRFFLSSSVVERSAVNGLDSFCPTAPYLRIRLDFAISDDILESTESLFSFGDQASSPACEKAFNRAARFQRLMICRVPQLDQSPWIEGCLEDMELCHKAEWTDLKIKGKLAQL
ncbi:hypothetical protein E5676_scaffold371G00260 [Cucumis melo var. makuwa]|uniref:Uncharacterized protein n=1 Tax=Cucumis melo var. makuwa TaxID=1194695 RepID=A0A5D3BDP2_CUCMM|nr:hypothetical protein E6C27_scaffold153G00320 [Cucumis melo var. makuwa]TYJ97119.1 hypothetical protein E5676_scaffold371G00260 [Cucumis melo var. makuwa]